MKEHREVVTPVRIRAHCREDGGELHYTGRIVLAHPSLYQHECSICKEIENLSQVYPYIEYE